MKKKLEAYLVRAIRDKDLTEVKNLLLKGADPSHRSLIGDILDIAVHIGDLDIFKALINAGSNSNRQKEQSLIQASRLGFVDIVDYLIDIGVDINVDNGNSITMAAKNGYLNVVKSLVESGAHISVEKDQPLVFACLNGHIEIVEYLVDNGADVSSQKNGPLYYALQFRYVDIVKYLVDKGADISFDNNSSVIDAYFDFNSGGKIDMLNYLLSITPDVYSEYTDNKIMIFLQKQNKILFNGFQVSLDAFDFRQYMYFKENCLLFSRLSKRLKYILKKVDNQLARDNILRKDLLEALKVLIKTNSENNELKAILDYNLKMSNSQLIDFIIIGNKEANLLLKEYGFTKNIKSDLDEIYEITGNKDFLLLI